MSKSDYMENKALDGRYGGPDFVRPATVYVGLFTATPSDAGGGTEVSGGAYARVAVTNNSTNFPAAASGSKSNGTAITFPTLTANAGTAVAFGTFDASTAGNLMDWGALLGAEKTFTAAASTDAFTAAAHGLVDGTPVKFAASAGVALPAGIVAGTTYYTRDGTTNTFKVAATLGGTAIDLTADGGGVVQVDYSMPLTIGSTPSFGVGSLVILED
jgi:hypothetical protein